MQDEALLKKDFSDMIKIFLEEQVRFSTPFMRQ
jgi:hypothetical protein